ncbi:MAG: bifunctional methylenetetrahydrofolate dehydrogenase/methenyltetrahydrofolate cyclohydrolase, partial [Proteobacteria bacterium]|nr:bifunctional methylenetetrahydrofolate dehydrogenase/methenyltetrahydrofolate cyclohydrolase [Pseudomonadota bacterium]
MTAHIIDGKIIAHDIKSQLKQKISHYRAQGLRVPCLAVILVGNDPASEVYVGHKKKACAEVGIESRSLVLPHDITQQALCDHLRELNANPMIDGILLQLPLPKHLNSEAAIDLISPAKDVDGLTPYSQGLLVWKRPGMTSCTPLGIMELIRSTGIELKGKRAVVIGRSVLVGMPIATLLGNAGATVSSLNSKTIQPELYCREADVLVVAAGVKQMVRGSWIKPGSVVIDVGIHRNADNTLVGDVLFKEAVELAGWITPVPGGVGPMTIASLLSNCLKAYEI